MSDEPRRPDSLPVLSVLLSPGNLTSVLLVVYAAGFIIANRYLAAQNIVRFDLVRLHYAAAGALFLVLAGYPCALGWLSASHARKGVSLLDVLLDRLIRAEAFRRSIIAEMTPADWREYESLQNERCRSPR